MNTIFISIIITTHNRRYELEKALDSAINQDFVGYEIIVVSDNSNEETKQFILEYKNSSDKTLRLFIYLKKSPKVQITLEILVYNRQLENIFACWMMMMSSLLISLKTVQYDNERR